MLQASGDLSMIKLYNSHSLIKKVHFPSNAKTKNNLHKEEIAALPKRDSLTVKVLEKSLRTIDQVTQRYSLVFCNITCSKKIDCEEFMDNIEKLNNLLEKDGLIIIKAVDPQTMVENLGYNQYDQHPGYVSHPKNVSPNLFMLE